MKNPTFARRIDFDPPQILPLNLATGYYTAVLTVLSVKGGDYPHSMDELLALGSWPGDAWREFEVKLELKTQKDGCQSVVAPVELNVVLQRYLWPREGAPEAVVVYVRATRCDGKRAVRWLSIDPPKRLGYDA